MTRNDECWRLLPLIHWTADDSDQPGPAVVVSIDWSAAIAAIQTAPSKAHYRARAAAGGLRKHSLNVCIHWQQQALSSHDESSALGFAPFAIRFTASVSRLDDSAAHLSASFRVSGHNDAEHSASHCVDAKSGRIRFEAVRSEAENRQPPTSRRRACSSAPVRLAALRPPLQEERVLPITRRLR